MSEIIERSAIRAILLDSAESLTLDKFYWWKASALHEARERLTPLSLANIVESYLRNGAPTAIPPVEVLFD